MSRTLIVCLIAWVVTRLFYLVSGFAPVRDLGCVVGYALDLGIWMMVCLLAYWSLGVLGVGKKARG